MEFLATIEKSFKTYLQTGARSNEKLKILHAKIAQDFSAKLGDNFNIYALGINEGIEKTITGHYYEKKVDISIFKNNTPQAGIAVKFIMSNYGQNANNYFEGMLGETANIRTQKIPYFQIIIVPEQMPYFDENGNITKIEHFKTHHLEKYIALSKDKQFLHAPNKTLLALIKLPDFSTAHDKNSYKMLCNNGAVTYSNKFSTEQFGENVILNNYTDFLNQACCEILGGINVAKVCAGFKGIFIIITQNLKKIFVIRP